jgi:hypothetical protein
MLIPASELELLRFFNGHGHITLTAYLRIDPRPGESVYEDFYREMQVSLDRCKAQTECREAIKEDAEIVGLYLKTNNGHRRYAAVAIFSCAAELFWRAYPLPVPLGPQVSVGPKFNVDPLVQLLGQRTTP